MRLFQGTPAAEALTGLGRCGLSATEIQTHFESGHLSADAGMLIASLINLLGAASNRGEAKDASLAALNQSHKLRLEVIKLIADIARPARGTSPQLLDQPISVLLSDAQAAEMRRVAARRS
jgi:hypothetical protein